MGDFGMKVPHMSGVFRVGREIFSTVSYYPHVDWLSLLDNIRPG